MEKGGSEEKNFVERVDKIIDSALQEGIFPGAVMAVGQGIPERRRILLRPYGKAALYPAPRVMRKDTFFDLASLTKPLITSLAVLCLIKEGVLSFSQTLPSLLKRVVPEDKQKITLTNLLGHSSGLPPYRPYFESLRKIPAPHRPDKLLELVLGEPLEYETGTKTVYSDLGFMLLGRIVEIGSGMDLAAFARRKLLEPLSLADHLFFRPLGKGNLEVFEETRFAATEKCSWRDRVLCGEVHDDNAFVLGGVAGHAGLFGDALGVLAMAMAILDQWKGRTTHPAYRNRDLAHLLRRQKIADSSWGLGFDTPSEGYSSGGRFLSPDSVGHLGFTGTSFWIDPHKEAAIILLTNRIHPDRHNNAIKSFRPLFHDAVLSAIASLDGR